MSNQLTDVSTGRVTKWNAEFGAAYVIAVDPSSGLPIVVDGQIVVNGATASDGVVLPIDSLAVTYTGGPPSTPNAVWVNTVVYNGNTYTQTYTFDSLGNLASQTAWVKV